MNEKEQDRPEQDEEIPPQNPLYGKFDEMVDAALAPRPPGKRILFRKQRSNDKPANKNKKSD